MAYERLNLRNGQVLRAEHLVHFENALASTNALASEVIEKIAELKNVQEWPDLLGGSNVSEGDGLTTISNAVDVTDKTILKIEGTFCFSELNPEIALQVNHTKILDTIELDAFNELADTGDYLEFELWLLKTETGWTINACELRVTNYLSTIIKAAKLETDEIVGVVIPFEIADGSEKINYQITNPSNAVFEGPAMLVISGI